MLHWICWIRGNLISSCCTRRKKIETRDKPGKGLAYILAETTDVRIDFRMQNNRGEWMITPEQKLEIFESYFSQLYSSERPSQATMEEFFSTLILPSISNEQVKILNAPITLIKIMVDTNALKIVKLGIGWVYPGILKIYLNAFLLQGCLEFFVLLLSIRKYQIHSKKSLLP